MADTTLLIGFPVGPMAANPPTFGTITLDGSTDAAEWIFQAYEAATITHLGFRYGARALTPPTYRISLQGVTNATPDGTIKGGGSPASATFTPPADATWNGLWQWIALTNSYTVARGEMLAIVIAYASGTVNGTNNSSFTTRVNLPTTQALPYAIENNAGSRTNQAQCPVFGYKSASMVYGNPWETSTLTQFSSDSTPDEYALRFVVPAGLADTYKVRGIRITIRTPAASKTVLVTLYDTDGTTALQTMTWDGDTVSASASERIAEFFFDEVSLSTLTCGSVYRIGFAPQETSSGFALRTLDVESNAELAAFPGGTDWYLDTRTNGGAWTDDSTVNFRRPIAELILADITEPAGGGGTVYIPQNSPRFGIGVS
jgi:hypothetical protein